MYNYFSVSLLEYNQKIQEMCMQYKKTLKKSAIGVCGLPLHLRGIAGICLSYT